MHILVLGTAAVASDVLNATVVDMCVILHSLCVPGA